MTGTCRTCGKRKKLPKKPQAGVERAHYERDPYCSRTCCEADLGIGEQPGARNQGGLAYGREEATA
jgi:hypothetical protein